ncbi:MAG TPA: hypothetical protein VF765_37670 [Polyangiaceae bacterium]
MIRTRHVFAGLASTVVIVAMSSTARALETLDIEIGAKVGYATSPLSPSTVFGGNPLGFGVGGRIGLAFKAGPYIGGSFMAYPAGNGSLSVGPQGATSRSFSTFLYGAELGYGIQPIDRLTIRPQLGFGDTSASSGAPVGITFWYLQPGVTGLFDLGTLFVGADVGMLLFANSNYEQAGFTFDAQVGVKF